jgi:hypothetical protein
MISTFRQRVEAYVGVRPDDEMDLLQDLLTESARTLVDILPLSIAQAYLERVGFAGESSLMVQGIYRVYGVDVRGIPAEEVAATEVGRRTSTLSLYAASEIWPIYWFSTGKVWVYPNDVDANATALAMRYPNTVVPSATSLAGFPDTLFPAVCLDAAINLLLKDIQASVAQVQTLTVLDLPGLDISAHLTRLAGYVHTDEDIELAGAEANEIGVLLNEYQVKNAALVQEHQSTLAAAAQSMNLVAMLTNRIGALKAQYLEILSKHGIGGKV